MPRPLGRLVPLFLAVLAIACCWAAPLRADDTSALINQQLDKPIHLQLNDVLPQAMKKIEDLTGVPMKADPSVWELLPWGRDTNINAKVENQTLRDALEAITRKLGLKFVLKGDAIELQPVPALRRLAGRSTVQELNALDVLASLPLNLAGQMPASKMLEAVDKRLADAKTPYAVKDPMVETLRRDVPISVPRNATLMDALEALDEQTSATWYPWGKMIVIAAKQDVVRAQLKKTISVRYNGVDVAQVLLELSQRCGVPFDIESGAIQQIPPENRSIRLVLDGYSVQDALEAIAGFTGLDYMVRDNGIYIWNQTGSTNHRDPVMILIRPRGTDMEILVPKSQVPPDLQDYIRSKTQKELDNLRDMMKEEGYVPNNKPTAPATQPKPKSPGEDL